MRLLAAVASFSFALAAVALTAPAAQAATIATGNESTTQPLEITPSSDPLTHNVDVGAARLVAYIRRMGATRTVIRVTLGELALASNCANPVGVRLYVREYQADDWAASWSRQVQSTGNPTLTSAHADLVFTIPPTTFVEGRAYAFLVQSLSPSSCRTASLRTWAHNSPTVSPGLDRCQPVPELGFSSTPWRMWHENGLSDAVPCPDGRPAPSNLDPSMPTGWLFVGSNGATSSFVRRVTDVGSPGDPANCGNLPDTSGIEPVWWRPYPGVEGASDYVCRFTQFSPHLDIPMPDWWYHGAPWSVPGRTGAPRDVYLRLDTINYDELIRRFRPLLKFDLGGQFWNASPATMTDHWQNKLMRRQVPTQWELFEHGGEGNLSWGLETLVAPGGEYPGGLGPPSEEDFIDAVGDHKEAADAFRMGPHDNTAYVHVVHDRDGKLWLQYWFFYYFNEQGPPEAGEHEGDWEMVQYQVSASGAPERATYAQHKDEEAESCVWSKVLTETVTDETLGTRQAPLVFVAAGSQASYFMAGVHFRADPLPDDSALGNGESRTPSLETIGEDFPSWAIWPGEWGGEGSPDSPGNQTKRWSRPDEFDSDARPCSYPDGTPR